LYCAEKITDDRNKPKSRRRVSSCVETIPAIDSIVSFAKGRNDEWGNEVLLRIQSESDLVAAEAKYHRDCAAHFRVVSLQTDSYQIGRPPDSQKLEAFQKLCQYLEENEECQYSVNELSEKMESFLDGVEGYEVKYLKHKLKEHYGKQILITNVKGGLENIVTSRDRGYQVLRDTWEQEKKADINTQTDIIIDNGCRNYQG
jgi:hypothetical protein